MADNVHTARSTHRKTFSFLSSSWFAPKFTLHPAGQRSSDSVPHEHCVDKAPPPSPASPDNTHSPGGVSSPPASSSHLLPPKASHSMRLARKVKNFGRDSGDNAKPAKPKQRSRVIGDMLEDPYSLMTMSPQMLVAPSPSQSSTSFIEPRHTAGSLRRSATIGNQANGLPLSQSGAVQRARSVGAFPSLGPPANPHSGERNLSPVVFAPREETSQPPSETSSAFYSESLVPSKPPSLIEEEEESPVSEVPTTAVSRHLRNISSGSNGGKSHARVASSASSLSKAARILGPSQDTLPEVVLLPASPHPQEPSGSSTSSQHAPPIIRRRSPSPSPSRDIAILEGDLLTNPPQRTMSLRRAQVPRASQRRLSLDLRTLSPEPFKTGPARLKKSRSASAGSRRSLRPDAADELVDSYLEEDSGQGEPVDAKQHALDVRRAKKMVQLFGDKPPKELFKIHSRTRDDTFDTISILTTVSENRRESRATFTSVTSSISISRHLRDSVQSSNSEPSSPLVFSAPEGSVESHNPPPAPERTGDSDKPDDKAAAEPEPPAAAGTGTVPASERAPPAAEESPTSPSRRSVHSRPGTPVSSRTRPVLPALSLGSPVLFSHSRSHSLHSQNSQTQTQYTSEAVPPLPTSPLSPSSAAPFSDLVPSHGPASPTSPAAADPAEAEHERSGAASPPPEDFRARRIRAAKLSRFFGVAPHDLTDALANPPASPTHASAPYSVARSVGRPRTPHQDIPSSFGSAKDSSSTPSLPRQSQSEMERSTSRERPSITVEVATEVPRPFRLGREKRPVQELDMETVLDQLRRMR
ncbi:hypothetical protein DAEQUDRAFT_760739 [Daedalea quercina L-15889]|uniref:Uncharacterized protein n=1 Tax=Daedalea quercina L-15889 TaxID=1314783 RepID=A0A165UCI3_9APHY|nr:hypothetical protein DAEQUDRAFT_760739 [Daedalea quercina L-15889]